MNRLSNCIGPIEACTRRVAVNVFDHHAQLLMSLAGVLGVLLPSSIGPALPVLLLCCTLVSLNS